ncbi:hypothetical protein ACFLQN_02250 [Candidatus Aenigmatarchaeota archaeon]
MSGIEQQWEGTDFYVLRDSPGHSAFVRNVSHGFSDPTSGKYAFTFGFDDEADSLEFIHAVLGTMGYPREGRRILYVSGENGRMAHVLGTSLENDGYDVDQAITVEQALELYDQNQHGIVIVEPSVSGQHGERCGFRVISDIKQKGDS